MKYLVTYGFILLSSVAICQNATNDFSWLDFNDLEQELSQKPLKTVVYFYADWCVYCKKMEQHAFKNKEVKRLLKNNFHAVKMNVESTDTIYFDGVRLTNLQANYKRRPIHQLALLLTNSKNRPITLPAILIFDEHFNLLRHRFSYMTSKELYQFLIKDSFF